MRGIESNKSKIRRSIFAEVAKLAYEGGDFSRLDQLPYDILPGEMATYRNSIFLERAIVGERLRLAIGLPIRPINEHAPVSKGIEASALPEKYYEPPLINIIKFACNACPEKQVIVTDGCQGCLEHPCVEVCPKNAVSIVHGRSVIDQDKCVKCGQCVNACSYNAIIKQERPCAKACGVNAIKSDEYGRAEIDYDKCVSCGQCMVNCPFSAIADKSQIFQTILAIKTGTPVYAAVAPSIAGQFGPKSTMGNIRQAFKQLGFADLVEVAVGADLCTVQEAKMFLKEVPDEIPFMGTSCCPAWSAMAKKMFPDQKECISMALTPMVLTARMLKKQNPNCKVVFIGPCAAKKLEASRRSVRSEVDFVLTFEEVAGMFDAKGVDFSVLPEENSIDSASADGYGFAMSGGVAQAVVHAISHIAPEREVKVVSAEGLDNCRKMLMVAKAGKYNGYLLEGMACPGGCVAGAGTVANPAKSAAAVRKTMSDATRKHTIDAEYTFSDTYDNWLYRLEDDEDK
ncbi:MAG: 4Fe-4S dicluster domain-containing protein [Acutalibacteraceae bacterium]